MNAIFLKKLRTHVLIIAALFFAAQTATIIAGDKSGHPYSAHTDKLVENLITETYKHLKILDAPGKHAQTQTLAYLDRDDLRANLNTCYNDKIKNIGIEFFKKFFTTILKKECDFKDNYRVFYHGQTREIMLLQDLYAGLHKIAYKKSLQDFIMLRIPDNDFSKFPSVKDFLAHYIKKGDIDDYCFDHAQEVRTRLLAVNPSLFSNTSSAGECSFYYFLNSWSIASIDVTNLAKNVFDAFKYTKYFSKYETEIRHLNTMLSESEQGKTGVLLQLFVPETLVNTLAYRCVPYGRLYHTKTGEHPASTDLDNYNKGPMLSTSNDTYDNIQFRLLINSSMLDPNSGIKFFRYYNRTDHIKKYKEKLKELLDKIELDVKKQAKK